MKARIVTCGQIDLPKMGLGMSEELGTRGLVELWEGAHATGSNCFSQKLLPIEKQGPREGKFQSTPIVCLGRRANIKAKLPE